MNKIEKPKSTNKAIPFIKDMKSFAKHHEEYEFFEVEDRYIKLDIRKWPNCDLPVQYIAVVVYKEDGKIWAKKRDLRPIKNLIEWRNQ